MTTNDLLFSQKFPLQAVRPARVKTNVGRHEGDQGSRWWVFHRPANETFERNLVMAFVSLLTPALKRFG